MSNLQPYRQKPLVIYNKSYRGIRFLAKTNRFLKALLGKGKIVKNVIKTFKVLKKIVRFSFFSTKEILIGFLQGLLFCFVITIFPLFWIFRAFDIGFFKGKSRNFLTNFFKEDGDLDDNMFLAARYMARGFVFITFGAAFIPVLFTFLFIK